MPKAETLNGKWLRLENAGVLGKSRSQCRILSGFLSAHRESEEFIICTFNQSLTPKLSNMTPFPSLSISPSLMLWFSYTFDPQVEFLI